MVLERRISELKMSRSKVAQAELRGILKTKMAIIKMIDKQEIKRMNPRGKIARTMKLKDINNLVLSVFKQRIIDKIGESDGRGSRKT